MVELAVVQARALGVPANDPSVTSANVGFSAVSSDYVASITLNAGAIEVVYQNTGATVEPILLLTPVHTSNDEPVYWRCSLS